MTTLLTVSPGLRTSVAALAVVLAGCAAAPTLPSAQQLQTIRTVDVVVKVPPSNFAYFQGGTTVYAQPSVGMSIGAGIGINIVANVLIAGIETLVTATAREAQQPVGQSVASLDLRHSVMAQLRDSQEQARSSISLTLSGREFPKVERDFVAAVSKPVADSDADAILYVSVLPYFRSHTGRMEAYGGSWLVSRSGTPLFSTSVIFVGPEHPDLERTPLVQWWAQERYRRFLQQSVRAIMLPTAEHLFHPPDEARRTALQQRIGMRQNSSLNSERMRSTLCPFQSDDAPVVYRFEQFARHTRIVAHCADEKLVLPDPELIPDISWVTVQQPPLPSVGSK